MNNKQAWNINAVFLLLLFGLAFATLVKPKRSFSENENRSLAQLPAVRLSDVLSGRFEQAYEDYLTDQFVMRDSWIGLRTLTERLTLKTEVHDIYFAKEDYLIEKHPGVFTTEQAAANITFLSGFAEKLSAVYDAGHLTVMVVPNAVDILREKLPAFAAPYDEEAYLRQLRSRLPSGVWFDASAVLSAHREEEIYYRTDHHWKTLGAFYVFQAWAKEKGLGEVLPEQYTVTTVTDSFEGTVASKLGMTGREDNIQVFTPDVPVEYELTYNRSEDVRSSLYLPSALESKDKYSYFFGGNYGLIEAKTGAHTGRSLLVIKDSYAHCFAPFLLSYFDQVDLLDLRYFNESLSAFMEEKNYTDVLFLQNVAGFAADMSMSRLVA